MNDLTQLIFEQRGHVAILTLFPLLLLLDGYVLCVLLDAFNSAEHAFNLRGHTKYHAQQDRHKERIG